MVMKSFFLACFCCCLFSFANAQDLGHEYIEKWKQFYPSKAVRQGLHESIFDYEDYRTDKVTNWLNYNRKIRAMLNDPQNDYREVKPIDTRLLKVQVKMEIDLWEQTKPHVNSVALYARSINNAIPPILEAEYLTPSEKMQLTCERLESIILTASLAQKNLPKASEDDLKASLSSLKSSIQLYQNELPEAIKTWPQFLYCPDLASILQKASSALQDLQTKIEQQWLPQAQPSSPLLGREAYARQLALYTDSDLTPEKLAEIALAEIETTKTSMLEVSEKYLKATYPNQKLPKNKEDIIKMALADMEKDAPLNAQDYLAFWQDLTAKAMAFIREKDLATLPKFETLRIQTAPESAGPAARIGWVDSAPPFDPNPVTTLYLPSIPDTLPQQEQIDFWASFNKPFNRMIVIHELYPGHYMQIKVSRETPHPVRLLFPYAVYFEGWATFTEEVLLDAGWEAENPLTLLAHLRKRMENANRAYTSVQVHCQGWTQEKVMDFSTTEALLAPQFAKSLWGRIMRSPMQLTSYFLGKEQFVDLLEAEKKRLGPKFELKRFMDTIMRAGPIPVDEFYRIFKEAYPS